MTMAAQVRDGSDGVDQVRQFECALAFAKTATLDLAGTLALAEKCMAVLAETLRAQRAAEAEKIADRGAYRY